MLSRPRPLSWRIGFAAAVLAIILALRYVTALWVGSNAPFLFQLPALMLIALFGGLWVGLAALGVTAVSNVLMIPAAYWTDPEAGYGPLLRLFSFGLNGAIFCIIAAALGTIVMRLRETRLSLDATALDRAHAEATVDATLAHAPLGLAFFDAGLKAVRVNAGLLHMAGLPEGSLAGRRLAQALPGFAAIEELAAQVLGDGQSLVDRDVRGTLADGTDRIWSVSCFPVRDRAEAVMQVGLTAVDVTELRRAMQALAESEQRYRNLAEALPKMVWTSRPDGTGDYYNRRWSDYTGSNDAALHEWYEYLHPDESGAAIVAWRQCVESGEQFSRECRFRAADGSYRWFLCRALPVRGADNRIERWYGSCTDISEIVAAREAMARSNEDLERLAAARTAQLAEANTRLKQEMEDRLKAEAQLRQAQKMEAVGQLTGGIAHDFNNLLTVVIGNLEAVERRVDPGAAEIRRFLDYGRQGALRAASLTQSLLAFSRQQPLDPRPLDINALISRMLPMLSSALNERVVLGTAFADGVWRVEADPNRLENAILNLVVNARDAMPDGGRVTIETANVTLGPDEVAGIDELEPGAYVVVSVRDTGAGMSADVQARAFEPFFTTKGPKEGTGLGLSQVYGFVTQSGGHVRIQSLAGTGTTVQLYLPCLPEPAADVPVPAPAAAEAQGGGARLLLVQDDPKLRGRCAGALREAGHVVLEAPDAGAALARLDVGAVPDLVVIDLASPANGGGAALAARIADRHPGLPLLFTGAGAASGIHHGHLADGARMLARPFTLGELVRQVGVMLGDAPRTGPVLLVEDEPFVAMVARQALEDQGFEVTVVSHGEAAIAHARALAGAQDRHDPVLAIVDLGLPDIGGDAVVKALREVLPELPVIVATGYGAEGLDLPFATDERLKLLEKPYDGAALGRVLASLGFSPAEGMKADDAG